MMQQRNILAMVIMLICTVISGYYGPWWSPALIITAVTALFHLPVRLGLFLGSGTTGLVFLCMASFQYAADEAGIISKTGSLLGGLSSFGMISITTLTGLITGFLSGWLGSVIGDYLKNTSSSNS